MNFKNFNNIFLVGAIIVIIFFVSFRFVNKTIEQQLTTQLKEVKKELLLEQSVPKPVEKKTEKRLLVPSDLTPYKIVEQRKSKLFKNQQYWDVMTRDILEESDILSDIQQGEAPIVFVKTPEEYKERIRMVDERIRKYKRRLRGNPNDDYARRKLQDMYMFKATIKILKEQVTSKH